MAISERAGPWPSSSLGRGLLTAALHWLGPPSGGGTRQALLHSQLWYGRGLKHFQHT